MNENKDDLIKYRISRAFETLREAELLSKEKFWNAAVNRAFYACYYMVSGLLLKNEINTKTHKGVRQMFTLHFIQTDLISRDWGRFFSNLFDKRQTGDYDDFVVIDKETTEEIIELTKGFLVEIERNIVR
jgi:uncharacterized protein (UPF0332 family)